MTRERWLECREHGPDGDIEYTLGGSDVATVLGVNPWATPLGLYHHKKGLVRFDDTENAGRKKMGQLMEPVVAYWYAAKTGYQVIEDTGLYQHADYPYALANLDFRVLGDGKYGIFDSKTTTWRNAEAWADDAIPYHYELQVRFYMAVMDLDYADLGCMWGFDGENEMAVRRVHRDRDIEAMIFERLDEFIQCLRTNTPPTMAGVDPELAMKDLARIYGASRPKMPTIELSKKHERALRRIADLQADSDELTGRMNKNKEEVTALSVKIAEMMGSHERGELITAADRLTVSYIPRSTRRPNSELLKKRHPLIYDEVLKTTVSRKIVVEVQAL
jgi:putative phage-type endonuclease